MVDCCHRGGLLVAMVFAAGVVPAPASALGGQPNLGYVAPVLL